MQIPLTRFRIEGLHNQRNIDITMKDNKLILVGENGLGKSTVANFIFIIQQGRPLFTVGAETLEGQPGQIIVVPPDTPHKFVNIGDGPLRQIDIHASKRFITEWLED